jgi:2-desacetyl-2-hydroxyethyl bacteriochlorophyllide A dehydrogenase
LLSGISHGTELNLYRGSSPFDGKRFDPKLRLFLADEGGSRYPMGLGYEWVGRVVETGPSVTQWSPGELVHLAHGHRETHVFEARGGGALPPVALDRLGLAPEQASMLSLAGVALQAVHDAHLVLGAHVAIFGLGAIGLLAIQLVRRNGAGRVDAVDPIASRRALAEAYGADRTYDPAAGDVGRAIKEANGGQGVDVAIEVSGHYAALHEALRSVRVAGVVVAAGYYQGGAAALRLGEEWHHNRITMRSSIGVWNCPHRDYPAWDRARVHREAAALLAAGSLQTSGLPTHRIPFSRAAEAYELIDAHPEDAIKVVLTY